MPRQTRGLTFVGFGRAIVLCSLALALAWLVVVVSLPRAVPQAVLVQLDPEPAASQLVYRAASEELVERRGQISDRTVDRVIAAWDRDPMAGQPLFFAGMRALLGNDLTGAERLLAAARARDPRLGQLRLALVATYLKTGRVAQAADEIAVVTRLVPRSGEILVPELANVVGDARARPALVAAIGDQPLMTNLLNHLASQNADPAIILDLAARQIRAGETPPPRWQSYVIDRHVAAGDMAGALALWSRFAGVAGGKPLLYDPQFAGLPGGPPFSWRLAGDGFASAERVRGGGLSVEFFGRRSGAIAHQLLALPPGPYRLRMRVEGDADGQGSQVAWKLACASGRALAELALTEITYTPKNVEGRFTVPNSGCAAQTLELIGTAGEFPVRQAVRISDLALEREGAAGR